MEASRVPAPRSAFPDFDSPVVRPAFPDFDAPATPSRSSVSDDVAYDFNTGRANPDARRRRKSESDAWKNHQRSLEWAAEEAKNRVKHAALVCIEAQQALYALQAAAELKASAAAQQTRKQEARQVASPAVRRQQRSAKDSSPSATTTIGLPFLRSRGAAVAAAAASGAAPPEASPPTCSTPPGGYCTEDAQNHRDRNAMPAPEIGAEDELQADLEDLKFFSKHLRLSGKPLLRLGSTKVIPRAACSPKASGKMQKKMSSTCHTAST